MPCDQKTNTENRKNIVTKLNKYSKNGPHFKKNLKKKREPRGCEIQVLCFTFGETETLKRLRNLTKSTQQLSGRVNSTAF